MSPTACRATVTGREHRLDDMVMLRADGTPTYMLSVVVDDHDMGITHIIRGDDHLTNAAGRRSFTRAWAGTCRPSRHIPLIHGPDGAKMSKRHGALGVDATATWAICPKRCAIICCGSAGATATRDISTEQAIAWFDLDAIGRSPSRFDFAKLDNLNGIYIRNTPDAELVAQIQAIAPEIEAAKEFSGSITKTGWGKLKKAMPGSRSARRRSWSSWFRPAICS